MMKNRFYVQGVIHIRKFDKNEVMKMSFLIRV